eukprot:1195259-Prorocentrum_minimum.AAC.2
MDQSDAGIIKLFSINASSSNATDTRAGHEGRGVCVLPAQTKLFAGKDRFPDFQLVFIYGDLASARA